MSSVIRLDVHLTNGELHSCPVAWYKIHENGSFEYYVNTTVPGRLAWYFKKADEWAMCVVTVDYNGKTYTYSFLGPSRYE